MAFPPAGLTPSVLRQVQLTLAAARDDQLARVAGLLERLENTGGSEALIGLLRSRLTQMRPPRPLAFTRLLFTPADPLVVPGPEWSRGLPGLPRTALLLLGEQVRAGPGGLVADIDGMIRGGHFGDAALIGRAGARLWPAAAAVLDRAAVPAGWAEATGLNAADHAAIARCAAGVLLEGEWLHASMHASAEGSGPGPDEMRGWLERATARRPESAAALLAVLLARLPGAEALLGPAPSQPGGSLAFAEPAIDFMLDRLEMLPQPFAGPGETAADIQRAVSLLDTLDSPGPAQRPSRRSHTERLRRLLEERCLTRFTEDLNRQVLAARADAVAQGELAALEEVARGLRRLESAARRLGGGERYDRMLSAAAREIGEDGPGTPVERARLVEILVGPEAAIALLQG